MDALRVLSPMAPLASLDGIVLRPIALPVRPDWAIIFGRDAPLLLEIGIGNGRVPRLAGETPSRSQLPRRRDRPRVFDQGAQSHPATKA
jgi:hypothetical protein